MQILLISLAIFLLLVLLSLLLSTLTTGMPPMPSHRKARLSLLSQIDALVGQQSSRCLMDLGSGWGHLVIPLARRYPQHQVIGYEVAFFPWLVSFLLKKALKLNNLKLERKNFLEVDLQAADLLVCYLMSPAMQQLSHKLSQQPKKPQWLLSHFFALPGYTPEQQLELTDFYRSPIYLYRLT